jgi:hypothetical protein
MIDTVKRFFSGLTNYPVYQALFTPFSAMADRLSCQCLTSAGLAINGAGSRR